MLTMASFHFLLLILLLHFACSLREFRSWSTRHGCDMALDANYPFAMEKYDGQRNSPGYEGKGRTNSNLQDFRHACQVRGGASKCHICEDIVCDSNNNGTCFLQLQGVDGRNMSRNVPTVTDTAWAVGGSHRKDYGNANTTHLCVSLTGEDCIRHTTTDFSQCVLRCFGNFGWMRALYSNDSQTAKLAKAADVTVIDQYAGMGRWDEDGQVDLWQYPKNCSQLSDQMGVNCTYSGTSGRKPSFNPQGFTFTMAGTGVAGFTDGPHDVAQFRSPDDIVADKYGYLYVADTMNNAIRMIDPQGNVTTLAGRGPLERGPTDGNCSTATFTEPRGLDVEIRNKTTVIVVADTGNHRIRRIDYIRETGECYVTCLTGLCGNNTLSFTTYSQKATPFSGYADGNGYEARFSAPEGVAFMDNHYIAVADTGNFLIRWVSDNGTTQTLAGTVIPGEADETGNPLGGCPPPCLQGQHGYKDGNLTHAQFLNPVDLTRGTNNTIMVTDEHRIRIIEINNVETWYYKVKSTGRVSTLAGNALQGHEDGFGDVEATLFSPSGIVVTNDTLAYFVDSSSCRVRRITPLPLVAPEVSCTSRGVDHYRPSGCTSFDQPLDLTGRKVTRLEANLFYKYGDPDGGNLDSGKYIRNCVGSPPLDTFDKHFVIKDGDNLVIDDNRKHLNEFSEEGMSVIVKCPAACQSNTDYTTGSYPIKGRFWYSEDSPICVAAVHKGTLHRLETGFIRIEYQRRAYINGTEEYEYPGNANENTVVTNSMTDTIPRIFTTYRHNVSAVMVHTVGGAPAANLEDGCGWHDAQPPSLAYFNKPKGITVIPNTVVTDDNFLYIADTGNHIIRGLSAMCTQICENGGSCIASDTCSCKTGWSGIDCTQPVCSTACGNDEVCVAPETCACKPGYEGANCGTPQCVQSCFNDGTCTAPDTCTCKDGWFDSNCTTPVCTNTCANGGNCTAPNTCACPAQWSGQDCRIPVCNQTCHNGGSCVAPDTCICPPQYTNYDCSAPICTQGWFVPNPNSHYLSTDLQRWPTYRQCNRIEWCNFTREFDCDQEYFTTLSVEVPSGPSSRAITGRKDRPLMCMNIELPTYYKLPFQILLANGSNSGVRRYNDPAPYESDSNNEERGYLYPIQNKTGPWTYTVDRQVVNVEWVNISQGVYVCANGGNCTSPGICECAPGWMGFDCRTPICDQGYYEAYQTKYVSGSETPDEFPKFYEYMDKNNSYNLTWPYSNPNYTMEFEFYVNETYIHREIRDFGNGRYLAEADWSRGTHNETYQGGYRCSIRSVTEWENQTFVYDHPNYYSRYMDRKRELDGVMYTHWMNMSWPAVHQHGRILDQTFNNVTYVFTNEGWRRQGIWNVTANVWEFGRCILQFQRNCTTKSKQYDLESGLLHRVIQDPDIAYRPRVSYNDMRVEGVETRWVTTGGECVDEVHRGCYNNGTCVAPNMCKCQTGWTGNDCRYPICTQTCQHNGACTHPDTCTCERGWMGYDCSIPICAQDCMNDGECVAPDTCKCYQWESEFRDGRLGGGRPLFQLSDGTPIRTGWTGFDCSTPICVQASDFYVNVEISRETLSSRSIGTYSDGSVSLGGHGGDHLLTCLDSDTGLDQPRCPQYDIYVTGNEGATFQAGCGFDPFDTGCCVADSDTAVTCYSCAESIKYTTNNTFFCQGTYTPLSGLFVEEDKFADYMDEFGNFKMCGAYHSPRYHDPDTEPQDYGVVRYYTDYLGRAKLSNRNSVNNVTSNRFLCNVRYWEQGDYIDDAGMSSETGVGSIHGLKNGRHDRINYHNMSQLDADTWVEGAEVPGEGVYACENAGSCLAPDLCSCTDGYEGFDCNTPLCRHLQPDGTVSTCSNGGICESKDSCDCVRVKSQLSEIYPTSPAGQTGWTGSDCTIPMCVQGFYDPFCTDLPEAPAGQGCYRCANGGNCTAPDVCTCAEGWSGFDCKTPLCEVVADPLTRIQLDSIFEDKVISFETDPCGVEAIYGRRGWKGRKYTRGNCTEPNICTCLCKEQFNAKSCRKYGEDCDGPWQDHPLMVQLRNVLESKGPSYIFGSTDCRYGYEGNVNNMDQFVSCHQTIYVPSALEQYTVEIIASLTVGFAIIGVAYYFISARLRQNFILAKIERRRSKRSSEDSITGVRKSKRSSARKSSAQNY